MVFVLLLLLLCRTFIIRFYVSYYELVLIKMLKCLHFQIIIISFKNILCFAKIKIKIQNENIFFVFDCWKMLNLTMAHLHIVVVHHNYVRTYKYSVN